ncbi:MAG: hypothetical protein MSG64_10275 [Pyrinomonadaceae bacterium MAG19_C2-C3]|nr:hypothetical protein [Pyrinomonadaceae bacterium MAG19_C2-C3]
MPALRDDEVRRLLAYLRQHISDQDELAGVEDILRSDEAQEYLREPELLAYFPELTRQLHPGGTEWKLRIIPHAHLRMVQRGFSSDGIVKLFARFIEYCVEREIIITRGAYTIFGRLDPRARSVTLRVDVDEIDGQSGKAHVVTITVGRLNDDDDMTINLPAA